ncbi:G-type lectin S-receptor-like serine/threonine-protein kinase LECRK3 [Prunus yedoensis var. nudiflora]|uniref:G-type lectin S-receptor-like serine/threonine-protein kinase LECRK3 n=1 Tax=Prunus yedoensis var. nudiflora TaxID=2094558 RepID=A0A314Y4P6_PRUYE|nr:G-type lectin S-receptor-like serine/threonine-protein kinase LECRK3 [Prunus yedoensis var. nudiflora]
MKQRWRMMKLHPLLKIDDDEEAKEDINEKEIYLMIAFWCIQEDPSVRPTMKNVRQMLEGTVEVSIPPNPSSLYVQSK